MSGRCLSPYVSRCSLCPGGVCLQTEFVSGCVSVCSLSPCMSGHTLSPCVSRRSSSPCVSGWSLSPDLSRRRTCPGSVCLWMGLCLRSCLEGVSLQMYPCGVYVRTGVCLRMCPAGVCLQTAWLRMRLGGIYSMPGRRWISDIILCSIFTVILCRWILMRQYES